jgi:adenylate kinase family enzyme
MPEGLDIMMAMEKVIIIGCPGAGKTTLAGQLAEITGLPLVHLDFDYHKPVWSNDPQVKKGQWRGRVQEMVKGNQWIIDGNYKGTFDVRFPVADTIVFLDYPRGVCLWRALKRRWQYRRARRVDMPEEWREKLNLDFVWFIWTFRNKVRPLVVQYIDQHGEGKRVEILKNSREGDGFLERIQAEVIS